MREKVRKRMREGEGGQGNRYVIISSNFRTFQVSRMKKLQDFHVFLVSRMLYLTLASRCLIPGWATIGHDACSQGCCCLQLSYLL